MSVRCEHNWSPTPDESFCRDCGPNRILAANASKWDLRFLEMARLVATYSKDPSTKVGAVITDGRVIVSQGYNGFPSKMKDRAEDYADREVKYSRVIHGEMNALIFSARPVTGMTLYTTPIAPCDRCCVVMLQAGITRFVFPKLPVRLEGRWLDSVNRTKRYIEECGATWTEIVEGL